MRFDTRRDLIKFSSLAIARLTLQRAGIVGAAAWLEATQKTAPSPMEILADAAVFGMCQEPKSTKDIETLAHMGVDFVVRGLSGAWHKTPAQAYALVKAKARLNELSRENRMVFCTMMTSSGIFPDMFSPEEFEKFASRDARGNKLQKEFTQGCINVPEYREFIKKVARAIIDAGVDGIHYDESYSRWFQRQREGMYACFCDSCCDELREYIRRHFGPEEARKRWGITDLDVFHYRQYLAKNGYTEKPVKNPLHDIWWEMELETTIRHEKEIVEDAKTYAWQRYNRLIVVNPNQFMIMTENPVFALESEIYDHLLIGTGWAHTFRNNGVTSVRILPPKLSFVPQYKMATAHAPGKHVVLFIDMWTNEDLHEVLPLEIFPPEKMGDLMQWLFAEAYASGCYFAAHFRFGELEGPLEPLTRCGRFYKKNRRLFVGSQQLAKVAVAYSCPSAIWDMYPQTWDRDAGGVAHCQQYYGVCQALLDENIQFETVFFGDGKFFPNTPHDGIPEGHEILLLPACYSVTDSSVAAIKAFLRRGGKVIQTGEFAALDEHHAARRQRPQLGPARNVVVVEGDFEAFLARQNPNPGRELISAVNKFQPGPPSARILTAGVNVQLHTRLSASGDAFVLHLINRDFIYPEGFRPAGPIEVEFKREREFMGTKTCYLLSPDRGVEGPVNLPLRKVGSDRFMVTVPRLTGSAAVVLDR